MSFQAESPVTDRLQVIEGLMNTIRKFRCPIAGNFDICQNNKRKNNRQLQNLAKEQRELQLLLVNPPEIVPDIIPKVIPDATIQTETIATGTPTDNTLRNILIIGGALLLL